MLNSFGALLRLAGVTACLSIVTTGLARAATLDAATVGRVQAATFEVVIKKPETDSLTYQRELPLHLLPYSERNDKYSSIGTAFAIGDNRYVTAAHVLGTSMFGSQFGEPAVRDGQGVVHPIDKILKYSGAKDFVVLSLKEPIKTQPLEINREPSLNDTVFAVGNALGQGIVIRDGLFTSQTPEERHGEWKWIRFSAAASPGNSGGPLLDSTGRVIGVVLRKSENENLNFAVPISLVLDAPDKLGTTWYQMSYRLPILDDAEHGEHTFEFFLPRGYADISATLVTDMQNFMAFQKQTLLRKHADTIFPLGQGSKALLSSLPQAGGLAILYRRRDGVWDISPARDVRNVQLDANGYVSYGSFGDAEIVKVRRPDNVPVDRFYDDSKYFGDTLMKAFAWERQVGPEQVPILSLGKAKSESTHVDARGRKWKLRSWNIEYSDSFLTAATLPVPDGSVSIVVSGPTYGQQDALRDIDTLTSFSHPQYTGTLQQWQEYLKRKDLLPAALERFQIDSDLSSYFKASTRRIRLEIAKDLQTIAPDSILTLHTAYPQEANGVIWDVVGLSLIQDLGASQVLTVVRTSKPDPSLPQQLTLDWQRVTQRSYPYNATLSDMNGSSFIATIHPYPAPATATPANQQAAYAATVLKQGKHSQEDMEKLLRGLAGGLTVQENMMGSPAP